MSAAITGWAVRTPLGCTVDELADRLLAGERAAAPNPHFDASTYGCSLAAAIAGAPPRSRHDRILRRMGRFGYHAAREALDASGVAGGPRLGLFAGVGGLRAHWNELLPALEHQIDDLTDSYANGFKLLHPFWMLHHLSNNTHALLSKDVDARGEGITFGGANAGAQALAAAIAALADGAVDAALVVVYDSLIEPETIVEMTARGAAAICDLDALRGAYDARAAGVVPAEAAAAMVLERGAAERALAFIDAADAADGSAGRPAADTLGRVVAAITRGDAIVDGAATCQVDADRAEREAIASVLGDTARLTAVQSATGALGAPAAAVQAIALAACLRRGALPPIAGLRDDPGGPLHPVRAITSTSARSAVAASAGAPGLAAAIRVSLDAES